MDDDALCRKKLEKAYAHLYELEDEFDSLPEKRAIRDARNQIWMVIQANWDVE